MFKLALSLVQILGGKMLSGVLATGKGYRGRGGASGSGRGGGRKDASPSWEGVLDLLRQETRQPESVRGSAPVATPANPELLAKRPVAIQAQEAEYAAVQACATSFLDGRVRLRHAVLRDKVVQASLQAALEQQGCFTVIRFSSVTGSLLLEYDAQHLSRPAFWAAVLPVGRCILEHAA